MRYLDNKSVKNEADAHALLTGVKYCMSVSEVMTGVDLLTWMQNHNMLKKKKNAIHFWVIVLQIALACYVMELAGVAHNDLHQGNVLVIEHPNPVEYCFFIPQLKPSYVRFKSRFQVKVFDFDRANFRAFVNPVVGLFTESYTYSTEPANGKDFLKLFVNIAHILRNNTDFTNVIATFRKQLTATPQLSEMLIKLPQLTSHLQLNKKSLSTKLVSDMFSMPTIIRNFIKLARVSQSDVEPGVNETVYVIDKSLFEKSRVLTSQVYNTLQKLQVQNAEAEYSAAHVKQETKLLESDIETEMVHVRNLQLEIDQQKYDLDQLQHQVNPILLQVVAQFQSPHQQVQFQEENKR